MNTVSTDEEIFELITQTVAASQERQSKISQGRARVADVISGDKEKCPPAKPGINIEVLGIQDPLCGR